MPSHRSVAASVRRSKEEHPECFCPVPRCLWRIAKTDGTPLNPCRNHPTPAAAPAAPQGETNTPTGVRYTLHSIRYDPDVVTLRYQPVWARHDPTTPFCMCRGCVAADQRDRETWEHEEAKAYDVQDAVLNAMPEGLVA